MGIAQISALVIAVLLIGLIIWWFFGKHQQLAKQANISGGKQEATVVVKGGYQPDVIVLKQGIPATVKFDMQDSTACLSHITFADLGINEDLTKQKITAIKIPTDQAGEIPFACGMDMFHGKVIIK